MVRLVSESSAGPGSMPDRTHCVVFSDKIKYSGSSSLHLDVWVSTDDSNVGGNSAIEQHTGRERNSRSHFMLQKPEMSAGRTRGRMGHLACMKTLPEQVRPP